MKKVRYAAGLFLACMVTSLTACSKVQQPEAVQKQAVEVQVQANDNEAGSSLEVHFLDVGQGDCTLLLCDGEAMLIDAGTNDSGTAIQLYLTKRGVKDLKYFVITHDDSDHEGGADVILTKFGVENLFMCAFPKDTRTHQEVLDAIQYKNLSWSTPSPGDTYFLGGASFTIVAPNKSYTTPNNSSIALLISHGNNSFLFTGDCEEEAEADMLLSGLELDADVYKVGHHGSNTASSQAFLDVVTPEFAVISCGSNNSYGHPRAETLNKLRAMDVQVYRTDEQGTIVCSSDGEMLTWNAAPSTTWQAGEPTGSAITENTAQTAGVTQAADEGKKDVMVWLSATGSKYHSKNNCGNMNPSKATQTTEQDAIAKGKGKCSKCW